MKFAVLALGFACLFAFSSRDAHAFKPPEKKKLNFGGFKMSDSDFVTKTMNQWTKNGTTAPAWIKVTNPELKKKEFTALYDKLLAIDPKLKKYCSSANCFEYHVMADVKPAAHVLLLKGDIRTDADGGPCNTNLAYALEVPTGRRTLELIERHEFEARGPEAYDLYVPLKKLYACDPNPCGYAATQGNRVAKIEDCKKGDNCPQVEDGRKHGKPINPESKRFLREQKERNDSAEKVL